MFFSNRCGGERKNSRSGRGAATAVVLFCLVLGHGGWALPQEGSSSKEPGAKWGDAAKPLTLAGWVKGESVDLKKMKGKKIVVLDFWSTDDELNLGGIARLSNLRKKYKDKGVVFVGISAEPTGDVRSFVDKMGANMDYTVAVDKNNVTSKAYLDAYGVKSPPHTFVVDKKGKVVWHGRHMGDLDKTLTAIVAGTYSMADARKSYEKRERAKTLVNEYFALVTKPGNEAKAKKVGEEILKTGDETPRILNLLSYNILAYPKVVNPDRDLALRAAKLALKLTKEKDVEIIDTYARALFDTGDPAGAIRYQKKAIEMVQKALDATEDKKRQAPLRKTLVNLRKTLGKYEAKSSIGK